MVLTAPLAIIKFNNIPIGKMRSINVDESINRGIVRGIGNLAGTEAPALTYDGTLTCDYYLINYKEALNKIQDSKILLTAVQSIQEFVDTILLNEQGVQVDIYKKVRDSQAANQVITPKHEKVATITQVFLNRKSMNINEGQISGANSSFMFLDPIIHPQ